jgi:dihydrolipoamide dehydrogenase
LLTDKGNIAIETDIVLSAAGVRANIENIGLQALGIEVECGKIKVNKNYCSSMPSVFAVGDVVAAPSLAHVAAAQARCCVEYIAGMQPAAINYEAIPSCIYVNPEVASVGLTEQAAMQRGMSVKVGKSMFMASGKAHAAGMRDGFVKLIFDAASEQIVGAHCIGGHATELLGELAMAVSLRLTAKQISAIVHAHPTMYEAIEQAARTILLQNK